MELCGRAHHRLLHRPTNPSREFGKLPGKEGPSQINPLATSLYPATPNTNVLVKTALVRINSASCLEKTARAMFDDGSEKTWIRKGLADELRLALAVDDVGAPVRAVRVTPSAWPHLAKIKSADSYPRGMQTVDV